MFAYFEDAAGWDENHWTKRLGGCLPELPFFNGERYEVKYTATKGMELFHAKKIVKFFKFHGAPDLVIKDVQRNALVPVITVEGDQAPSSHSSDVEEQSSGDSQGTDVLVVENSLISTSRSKDPIVLQKVGELLSNMHILLLKKALKRLKEQSTNIATNLNVKLEGGVVSRGYSTAMCL